jgi:hypothetical protein
VGSHMWTVTGQVVLSMMVCLTCGALAQRHAVPAATTPTSCHKVRGRRGASAATSHSHQPHLGSLKTVCTRAAHRAGVASTAPRQRSTAS